MLPQQYQAADRLGRVGCAAAGGDTDETEAGQQQSSQRIHIIGIENHMTTTLREKIISGRMAVGTWLQIPDVGVVEILAQAGFDYLLVAGGRAPINPSQLVPLALAAERRGCPIIYRVQTNSADLIKAALDAGVDGLMVPMVETAAEAAAGGGAGKRPTRGGRG